MIGIDLGFQHSCIAYLSDQGPQILKDETGAVLIPTAIAMDSQQRVLVGTAAEHYLAHDPNAGSGDLLPRALNQSSLHIGNVDWSNVEVLNYLFKEFQRVISLSLGHETLPTCCVSIPAYLNDSQRQLVLTAVRAAGLDVHRLLNKPSAALLSAWMLDPHAYEYAIVLEINQHNFDVSCLAINSDGQFEILSTNGLNDADFTHRDGERFFKDIEQPFKTAITDSGLSSEALGHILVCGQSALAQEVHNILQRQSGIQHIAYTASEAIARGAAYYATLHKQTAASNNPNPFTQSSSSGCLHILLFTALLLYFVSI